MEQSQEKRNKSKNLDEIPITTPSRIVVQSREQSYTFDKGTYREDYLRHIISKSEYEKIIQEASKLMGQSWTKKRLNDQIKLPTFVIVLSVICLVLTLIYMILIYLSTGYQDGSALLATSIACVSVASIIAFGLSVYNFCRKINKFKSLEEIIKEDLDAYFENINLKYEGLLYFNFNSTHRWIECNILKVNEKAEKVEERKHYIPEEVEEDPENENELDDEVHNKLSKKHSRMPSHITASKKHSKSPSLAVVSNTKVVSHFHSRAQSTNVRRAEEAKENKENPEKKEIELLSFRKEKEL